MIKTQLCYNLFSTAVKEISDLLNTGLDGETLRICVQLLEAGVNPEALAAVVLEIKREASESKVLVKIYYEFLLYLLMTGIPVTWCDHRLISYVAN